MKITRRQIESALIQRIEDSARKLIMPPGPAAGSLETAAPGNPRV
jgi:hypothetical protein